MSRSGASLLGTTTFELGKAVGASGRVLGIDVSAPMLARAHERLAGIGVANVNLVEADASTYSTSIHQRVGHSTAIQIGVGHDREVTPGT